MLPGSTAGLKPKKRGRAGAKAPISITGLTPGVAYQPRRLLPPDSRRPDRRRRARRAAGIEVHGIDCATARRLPAKPPSNGSTSTGATGTDGGVARVAAVVHNAPGSLAALTAILAHHNARTSSTSALSERDRAFHTFVVDIEVDDLAHLTNIVAALRATKAVVTVERVKA